ncbi:DNA methyltransferase [Archangium lansingense]|uniref:DNA methyltransferase n=1 Tax=Archangium lansingense TaxID=2995310 RepID=A0ABT4A294_9BACT|nr:DNA methyltransferase [Archangium lansinium]MCY1075097.1 DNA methyltransferase [Archangium lansinium]
MAMEASAKTYKTAEARWAGIGPYYAMFPSQFADAVIAQYTSSGDLVFDPFAGRGTAVFSATAQSRIGVGVEINPVGWIYSQAKLHPASCEEVSRRYLELRESSVSYGAAAKTLPPFFHKCFSVDVRRYLLAARTELCWKSRATDWTAMALLLVHLHGKKGTALSNQLHQAKAMAPDYALKWWTERRLSPPRIDPAKFLISRLSWRYAKGIPSRTESRVLLGDSVELLPKLIGEVRCSKMRRARLLFTSPPYFAVTNYHYDQWLRLWLLGGSTTPARQPSSGVHQNRFENFEAYRKLLFSVFLGSSEILMRSASVYVRTSRRPETFETTMDALRNAFPRKKLRLTERPFLRPTQTHLFGDHGIKQGEVDIVLT